MTLPVQARAKVIAEMLQSLGVTNVMDTTQPITLAGEKLDALRTCQAFSTPESSRRTARVFDIHSSASGDFSKVGSITKRLAALIKVGTGIKVVTSSQLRRQEGVASRAYTIRFDATSVSGMAQLLKLKYGRLHRSAWACSEVADYLEQLQLSEPYSRHATQQSEPYSMIAAEAEQGDGGF